MSDPVPTKEERAREKEERALVKEARGAEKEKVKAAAAVRGDSRRLYASIGELATRHPDAEHTEDLTRHEYRVFSQNGEDGVVAELLRRLAGAPRHFVEFGIGPGTEGNAVFLADVMGWAGCFIEPDPAGYADLERKYRFVGRVETLEASVTAENVEALFDRAGVPEEPGIVSIDVDGNDYWLWKALERYRPQVVVIEYNSSLDPHRQLVQPYDPGWRNSGTDFFGASLGALRALGESKGYRLAHTELAGVNAFFVRADLDAELPDPAEVPARPPNFDLAGRSHRPHASGATYIDLAEESRR